MLSSNFNDSAYTALCSTVTLQSNKNGFFQQIVDSIESSVDDRWLNEFSKLKSNKERLRRCLIDKQIKDKVYQMMDNVQEIFRGKSAQISCSRRQEAEHLLKIGKTDKALVMYTQSIVRAPTAGVEKKIDEGLSLALALWGRSTVLYHLEKINFCLEDVKLALKEKLPDYLKFDAFWRMAECYIRMNQFDHARITLNVLLKMATSSPEPSKRGQWIEKIQSKLTELATPTPQNKTATSISECRARIERPHSVLENASAKLNLSHSEQAGRFLIAGNDISTGDTLIVEDPYVACLSVEKYGSHCQHCLRRLKIAIPCSECSGIAFCSVTCRSNALSTYHKFECRYLDLMIGSGMSILCFAALRIVSQRRLKYFLDADLENGERNSGNSYTKVYNMVTHEDKRTASDFLRRTIMALFLLAVLKKAGYFESSKKVDDIGSEEILIACVLLRNLEVLQFNVHEISEAVKSKDANSIKTSNIGVGLYSTASNFNHDCFPAVSRYFNGVKLLIKAVRPISKGCAVGDNYGPIFTKMGREERRIKLRARYWFECECQACLKNWPTLDKLDDCILRTKCPANEKAVNEQINKIKQFVQSPLDELYEEETFKICETLDSVNKNLPPPHKVYVELGTKLTQCWMNTEHVYIL